MRYLCLLLVLALAVAVAWPYVYLYRLDRALLENDRATLAALVDMERLRANHKAALEHRIERTVGREGPVARMAREGARWINEQAADRVIDLDWVRERLRRPEGGAAEDAYPSILRHTRFAFYDSPTTFLVRIGELGRDPVHLRMGLRDWEWRVQGIYE